MFCDSSLSNAYTKIHFSVFSVDVAEARRHRGGSPAQKSVDGGEEAEAAADRLEGQAGMSSVWAQAM